MLLYKFTSYLYLELLWYCPVEWCYIEDYDKIATKLNLRFMIFPTENLVLEKFSLILDTKID